MNVDVDDNPDDDVGSDFVDAIVKPTVVVTGIVFLFYVTVLSFLTSVIVTINEEDGFC